VLEDLEKIKVFLEELVTIATSQFTKANRGSSVTHHNSSHSLLIMLVIQACDISTVYFTTLCLEYSVEL
jgi:hypothetical protein